MLAVDTNVVVRLLNNDDPAQTKQVVRLFEKEKIYLSKTVLLETEWILRGVYKLGRDAVKSSLRRLVSLANVQIENEHQVAQALNWFENGFDFADAMHLASRGDARQFVSFDAKLIKQAKALGVESVIHP